MIRLYSFYRSTSVWRVRIALNWKGIAHELVPVHLLRNGGEQHALEFAERNPLAQIPVLEVDEGEGLFRLTQSMAILEYLDFKPIEDLEFRGNFTSVAVRGGGGATRNLWSRNWWDEYEGFDRDRDGAGDTPFELRAYADRIWMEIPPAAFFRASPLFEALDFLDRLAPFSTPTLILRDESPRFDPPAAQPAAARAGRT